MWNTITDVLYHFIKNVAFPENLHGKTLFFEKKRLRGSFLKKPRKTNLQARRARLAGSLCFARPGDSVLSGNMSGHIGTEKTCSVRSRKRLGWHSHSVFSDLWCENGVPQGIHTRSKGRGNRRAPHAVRGAFSKTRKPAKSLDFTGWKSKLVEWPRSELMTSYLQQA